MTSTCCNAEGVVHHVDNQITTWHPHGSISWAGAPHHYPGSHAFHKISTWFHTPGACQACGWPNYHMTSTCCNAEGVVHHVDNQITTWHPHGSISWAGAPHHYPGSHAFHKISTWFHTPGACQACGWPNYHMTSTCCNAEGVVHHVDNQITTWHPHGSISWAGPLRHYPVSHALHMISTCCHTSGAWRTMWITHLQHGIHMLHAEGVVHHVDNQFTTWSDKSSWEFHVDNQSTTRTSML